MITVNNKLIIRIKNTHYNFWPKKFIGISDMYFSICFYCKFFLSARRVSKLLAVPPLFFLPDRLDRPESGQAKLTQLFL